MQLFVGQHTDTDRVALCVFCFRGETVSLSCILLDGDVCYLRLARKRPCRTIYYIDGAAKRVVVSVPYALDDIADVFVQ